MEVPQSELRPRASEYHAWAGRSVLVTNLEGLIEGTGCQGYYYENTRLLSCFRLTADGRPLSPIIASPVQHTGLLAYHEIPTHDEQRRERKLYVSTGYTLGAGLRIGITAENCGYSTTYHLRLCLHLDADFADIIEAEEGHRQQTAPVDTTWDAAAQRLTFRYCHPRLDRAVSLHFEEAPSAPHFTQQRDEAVLSFDLNLQPHVPLDLHLTAEPCFDGVRVVAPTQLFSTADTPLGQLRAHLHAATPRLVTSNTTVARAWATATDDLCSLPLGVAEGPATPIAGLPLYQQFFGRDSLTIGWQSLMVAPTILRDALLANAAYQGTTTDDWRDEQPGRILHQHDLGPVAALDLNSHGRYYGDYTAPQDFLMMLAEYLAWTGDLATVRGLLPAARRVLAWLECDGDLDGDGFLEWVTRSSDGIKNQGWKDSWDAFVDECGDVVPNPIASDVIQGYWYAALRAAALAFFLCGEFGEALRLYLKSRALQRHFDRVFWVEDAQFYAMGLDPHKRQIRSISSNGGHLLASGIAPRAKGRRVAKRLMQPDLFSGWGIRTLSADHPAFNPFAYHLGSVWPMDSGTFAMGFARYGCYEELHRLAEGLFAASDLFVLNRLPEVLGGMPRDARHPHPGVYPRANSPQGWSSGAIVSLIVALLGLRARAPLNLLLLDPHLPAWLPTLRIEGICIGRGCLDLEVWLEHEHTRYRVTRSEGGVRVLRQPPPNSPQNTLAGRGRALIDSLWPW